MNRLERLFGIAHPVALVTGAGSPRIGACIARSLAARGCRLVLHAHRSYDQAVAAAEQLSDRGPEAMAVQGDLGDEASVDAVVQQARSRFGRIDALVHCAAIWERKRLEETTAADLRRHWEINTAAAFFCCQRVGLLMAGQPMGGAIVTLGDWATVRPYQDYAAYFVSKGAIPALTRTLAVELARRNPRVRVNAILPGPVMLPADLPEAERREAIAGTLVGREGSPDNVADAVLFLIENDFVTGVCLPVDGGRSVYAPLISA